MDQAQLVARVLRESAAAREAITASYMRLWRAANRSLIDAGGGERVHEPQRDPRVAGRAERSSRDAS